MKKLGILIALALCLCMLTAVASADTFTGTAAGFGGDVNVTIEVADGKLVSVAAEGANETSGVGSNAIAKMPDAILAAGTWDVDSVSGCTISSSAVRMAAKSAMIQAGLVTGEAAEVKMAPGTYHGEANGFVKFEPICLDITVDETKILDIAVTMENGETIPVFQACVQNLIPRMIEAQSVRVDSITGASASSAGIKAAVESALKEALAAGGSEADAIEAFYGIPEKTELGQVEKLETEVLVVGMGGSGTYAATRAAESGAKVLAIEKMARYGGTTGLTSEMFAVNPQRIQEICNEGNDFVDADAMRNDWLTYVEGDGKPELIEYMITKSGEALDWLNLDHHFDFDYEPAAGFTAADPFLVKWKMQPSKIGYNKEFIAKYFDGIIGDFTAMGGEYMLETEGYGLILDENGSVAGVKARNLVTGKEYEIYAKSVILATGGFAGNAEMEIRYLAENPYFDLAGEWKLYGNATNDGKMIQAAIDNGAETFNIGVAPMVHNAGIVGYLSNGTATAPEGKLGRKTGRQEVWSTADIPLFMASSMSNITINRLGERFTNEEQTAHLNSWISGPRYFTIWTEEQVKLLETEGFTVKPGGHFYQYLGYQGEIPMNTPLPDAGEVLADYVAAGLMYKADTLAELAAMIGCDAATLENTVATYNGYCAAGVDEAFGKAPEYLREIGEGPYYAVIGAPVCYSTCGGLDINDSFEVLKADGTAIGNLYAVGTDSMGVIFSEKKAYVTYGGGANGWGLTSGYLCGEIAAKAALAE